MRYLYFIFFLPFFALSVYAQKYDKDIVTDRITINAPDQTVTAYTHAVKEEVIPDPQKNYYWYSANKINRTQGGYSGRLLNGIYSVFYTNKNLKELGGYRNGLQHGQWKSWYENGNLKEITQWKSGDRDGRFYQYDDSGTLKLSGRYKKNEYNGKITTHFNKDSSQVISYKDGTLITEKQNATGSKNTESRFKRALKKIIPKRREKVTKKDKAEQAERK